MGSGFLLEDGVFEHARSRVPRDFTPASFLFARHSERASVSQDAPDRFRKQPAIYDCRFRSSRSELTKKETANDETHGSLHFVVDAGRLRWKRQWDQGRQGRRAARIDED